MTATDSGGAPYLSGATDERGSTLLDSARPSPTAIEPGGIAVGAAEGRVLTCPKCGRLKTHEVGGVGYFACPDCALTWDPETGRRWRHRADGFAPDEISQHPPEETEDMAARRRTTPIDDTGITKVTISAPGLGLPPVVLDKPLNGAHANGPAAKPAEPPKPRVVKEWVDRKLTDHDCATRGTEHRAILRKLDDTKAEAREVASDYRSRLVALQKRELEMRNAIDTGVERIAVECTERRNEQQHTIELVRIDNGKVLKSRAMSDAERQLTIPGTGPAATEVREAAAEKPKRVRRSRAQADATA